jgi:hypothetical protein
MNEIMNGSRRQFDRHVLCELPAGRRNPEERTGGRRLDSVRKGKI